MAWDRFKTKKGMGFLLAVAGIFAVTLLVVGKLTLSKAAPSEVGDSVAWAASMHFMQGASILVYSAVFTLLGAIALSALLSSLNKQS